MAAPLASNCVKLVRKSVRVLIHSYIPQILNDEDARVIAAWMDQTDCALHSTGSRSSGIAGPVHTIARVINRICFNVALPHLYQLQN